MTKIPIFFTFDRRYVVPAAVAFHSLLRHADPRYEYCLYVLYTDIPEADRVAQALDLYVNGSLNFFNHRTTVDISNRLVCFDIKGLGKNLKKPGMLIVHQRGVVEHQCRPTQFAGQYL